VKQRYMYKRMHIAILGIITVFSLILGAQVSFAETLVLTLNDAIAIGLKNSLDIKSKQLAVDAAQKDIKSAKSAYYPGIMVSSGYSHRFDDDQQGAAFFS